MADAAAAEQQMAELLARMPPSQRAAFAEQSGIPPAMVEHLLQQVVAEGLRVAQEGDAPLDEAELAAGFGGLAPAANMTGGQLVAHTLGVALWLAFWVAPPALVAVILLRRGMTMRELWQRISRPYLHDN